MSELWPKADRHRVPRLGALLVLALLLATPAAAVGQEASPAACSPAVASPPEVASPAAGTTAGEIDVYLTQLVEERRFSGSVLVARGGAILLERGYGLADRSCAVPNTPETTFRIGSITKQFTAMAILQLQEAGKLDVDDPITRYLPDYPIPARDGVAITVHHLLSHTSGIPEFFTVYSPDDPGSWPRTPREIVYKIAANHPLDFTPGTTFSYSNTGYLVLGLIVEEASGERYETYLREQVFAPLGMDATGFEAAGDARPDPAVGYNTGFGVRDDSARTPMAIPYAAGGMFSTVGDLYRWDRALYTEQLVGRSSVELMFTPVLEDYAYGWIVADFMGHRVTAHGGSIDGFLATIVRFVDDDAVIIILANQGDAEAGIFEEITQILFAG
jgi:CubicO group peptidase (beta-lactamase class C family)